jgi:hypothetical protein
MKAADPYFPAAVPPSSPPTTLLLIISVKMQTIEVTKKSITENARSPAGTLYEVP